MGNIKGTFFLNTVKALRRGGAAAREAVPPSLRHYVDARILASSWYPEEDHLDLLRTLIALGPKNDHAWEEMGRISADRDMGSVYKALLVPGDPGRSFERLRAVWSLAHDTGTLGVEVLGPGHCRIELRDWALVSSEFCRLNTSFFATVLRAAGADGVALEHARCRALGDPLCLWDASWSAQ